MTPLVVLFGVPDVEPCMISSPAALRQRGRRNLFWVRDSPMSEALADPDEDGVDSRSDPRAVGPRIGR
jgi:hypothetical protein